MITIHADDCSAFQIIPADGGQIIEYAYAVTKGGYLRRTTDHSDGSVSYEHASYDEWHSAFAPQNGDVPEDRTVWRAARVTG